MQAPKSSIKKKCKELRANLKDESLRKSILTANNLFKKLVKRKKEEYKREIIQNMNTKKGNQNLYWKLLDKLQMHRKDVFKSPIPGSKWNEYFKKILVNQQEPTLPQDFQDNGPLDYLITEEELKKASYILKPNKSSGYDCVSNEMIIGLLEVKPALLVKLFNNVFKKNQKIDQWSIALISPILKNGMKMIPGNYRGISVLSCLETLFTLVLNQRLLLCYGEQHTEERTIRVCGRK